jgi:hypothetical protein
VLTTIYRERCMYATHFGLPILGISTQFVQEREMPAGASSISLNDRSYDLVLLSNWEDQIIYEPEATAANAPDPGNLATPLNKALESGAWTQSIIWDSHTAFRDFTQIEFNHEDDIVPEERPPGECNHM